VLAQQVVAMVSMEPWHVDDLAALVRRTAVFAELPDSALFAVLDMLSGRYPSDEFAELRPRVTWDRLAGTLKARHPLTPQLHFAGAGQRNTLRRQHRRIGGNA
jgi:ATP-dependent Lhr-like helicase